MLGPNVVRRKKVNGCKILSCLMRDGKKYVGKIPPTSPPFSVKSEFPIIHEAVVMCFARYFQVRDFPASMMWAVPILKLAAVCPIPSCFRRRTLDKMSLYRRNFIGRF